MARLWLRTFGILAVAFAAGTGPLQAQQYWPDRSGGTVVRADFLKPFFSGGGEQLLTGAVFFSGSGPLGKVVRIEADIPLVRAGFSGGEPGDPTLSSLRLANPYVGVRMHRAGRRLSGYFGLRLPLATDPASSIADEAMVVGAISDPDRFEAFLTNVLTARGGVELRSVSSGGMLFGVKLGPSILVPTKGGDDAEMFADYGVQGGYEGAAIRAAIAITGRLVVTESGGSIGERTQHQVTGVVEVRRGPVRPGVLIRVPLDSSVRVDYPVTLGFGLVIVL